MHKLIYAIMHAKKESVYRLMNFDIGIQGINGKDLSAVSINDVWAVVSDTESLKPEMNNENALEFASVTEKLFQLFTLLPMRYGSILKSNDEILNVLEKNYDDIRNNLLKVEGKSEYGLKVFRNTDDIIHKPVTMKHTEGNSVYKDYILNKFNEYRSDESLLQYSEKLKAEIAEHISGLNADIKCNKITGGNNVYNAVLLLGKDMTDKLTQTVIALQSAHKELKMILTGPWAPYNFVDITLK
jgi:Gas vesicle synthesis protein GvpL/GvpF